MSHTTTAFIFPPIGTPMNLDQSPFATPRENQSPSPTFSSFSSNMAAPSQNFRDTPLPLPSTPNIDPLAIDILAKDFKLEPVQRANLHAFIQIGSADGTLSKSDLLTRVYLLATLYSDAAERRQATRDQGITDLKGLFNDLKIRLEAQFELTKDQNTNIRKVANDMIYQHTRTNFITMNVDVMKYIRENHASMGLSNVIGNPARERALSSSIKKTCSSVRNALRQDIRDSIIGAHSCSLAEFTYHTANKYRRGQFDENMSFGYTVHNVILRRFGLDNIKLIKKAEKSVAGGDHSEDSDSTETPTGSKRARRGHAGKVAKGEDFWSQVDVYFAEMVTKFGRDLTGAQWRECVNDLIRRDNGQFTPHAIADNGASSQPVAAQGASLFSAFSEN